MLEKADDSATLTARLDEPLPAELDAKKAREVELRRQARDNRSAVAVLRGLKPQR